MSPIRAAANNTKMPGSDGDSRITPAHLRSGIPIKAANSDTPAGKAQAAMPLPLIEGVYRDFSIPRVTGDQDTALSPIEDLRAECDELYAFVAKIPAEDWALPTDFWAWSTKDEILHLYIVDQFALTSLENPKAFAGIVERRRADIAAGIELSKRVRDRFGEQSKAQVLEMWRTQYERLCDVLSVRPLSARTAWFGPDMSIMSMISARQMEVWAHGQDIYDLFGSERAAGERIRNICELGVRTYRWTFQNRGLAVPEPAPEIRLTAPSGAFWQWNRDAPGLVTGRAEDFALVVTQRRNVRDTALQIYGANASSWMALAQCFAGPPADPPPPHMRAVHGRRSR
jgi:uncharacterized protein (TIGR03084 family)